MPNSTPQPAERRWKPTPVDPGTLDAPLHWRTPSMIFVNSMSDLFHEAVPFEFIDQVFAVMALCPQHTFQCLSKRPERMAEYVDGYSVNRKTAIRRAGDEFTDFSPGPTVPLPNVWLGASAENQATLDERVPHLLRCPAAVRFLSLEPLLGPLDLHDAFFRPRRGARDTYKRLAAGRIQWVIVGGESGAQARPCNVEWIGGVVRQCAEAGVPCFVKQLGASVSGQIVHPDNEGYGVNRVRLIDRKGGDPSEWPEDLRVRQFPEVRK